MNTYYLVPEAEYRLPYPVQNFDSATDSIINDSHLNDYDRAIALQDSLSKYLNATRTVQKEGSLDKEKHKTVVLELLKDLQIPQPPPPPTALPPPTPRRPLKTPFKRPQILGTFLSPPPPATIHQYNTDDESDDPDRTVLPPRIAHTVAASKIIEQSKTKRGGGWITRN